MFFISGQPKFHMRVSSGSYVIATESTAKENFRTAAILIVCVSQNITLRKFKVFSIVYYHTSFHDLRIGVAIPGIKLSHLLSFASVVPSP
jgi:hypothetical protein